MSNPNIKKKFDPDWDKIEKLLEADCSGVEIAAYYGVHPDSLYNACEAKLGIGFSELKRQKRRRGDAVLKEAQVDNALSGNTTMQVWLGKQRLGQRDNPDDDGGFDGKLAQFLDMYKSFKRINDSNQKDTDSPD